MIKKIKIAYISVEDSSDVRSWSGTTHFIKKAISKEGVTIEVIDNLKISVPLLARLKQLLGKIFNKKYDVLRNKKVLMSFAEEIEDRISKDVDYILASSSIPITYLETNIPIFFYTDATFHSMLDFYFPINKLSKKTIFEGNEQEQLAINRATGIFYSSQWAADSATNYYKADKNKIKVVLFGSNIKEVGFNTIKKNLTAKRNNLFIKLLFLGVDWDRKGGKIVFDTAKLIHESGYKVHLDFVGIPDLPIKELPDYCENHGFVDKSSKEGQDKIKNLFLKTDFLFVPSKQECFGIIFAEANAFAVPSITTNSGGIPSVIEDGVNGYTLDVNASPNSYKELIIRLKDDKEKYEQLALNAYEKSLEDTNWNIIGNKIIETMKQTQKQ